MSLREAWQPDRGFLRAYAERFVSKDFRRVRRTQSSDFPDMLGADLT